MSLNDSTILEHVRKAVALALSKQREKFESTLTSLSHQISQLTQDKEDLHSKLCNSTHFYQEYMQSEPSREDVLNVLRLMVARGGDRQRRYTALSSTHRYIQTLLRTYTHETIGDVSVTSTEAHTYAHTPQTRTHRHVTTPLSMLYSPASPVTDERHNNTNRGESEDLLEMGVEYAQLTCNTVLGHLRHTHALMNMFNTHVDYCPTHTLTHTHTQLPAESCVLCGVVAGEGRLFQSYDLHRTRQREVGLMVTLCVREHVYHLYYPMYLRYSLIYISLFFSL